MAPAEASPIRILQRRVWREGLVSLRLERPESFTFEAGQFVRIGAETDNGYVARAYSLVNPTSSPYLEIFVTEVAGGALSPTLTTLPAGSTLSLEKGVWGQLTPERIAGGTTLWCLATGTGLAPYLSILAEEKTWQMWPHVVLVHSVRFSEDLAYSREIEAFAAASNLAGTQGRLLRYVPVVTREATQFLSRRIPQLLEDGTLEDYAGISLSAESSRVLICGAPDMVKSTRALLKTKGFISPRRGASGNLLAENLWQ